jgi:hypothetical protein
MMIEDFMNVRPLLAIAVLSVVSPAVAAGQDAAIGVFVQGAIGSHYGDGGDTRSIGLGISFGKRFAVVVNAERSHVPTDVTFFADGYAATRGGTTRFVSGEFRYVPVTYKRLSPYVIAGVGRGVSRPNVNQFFPVRVTHDVMLVFPGFGARVRLTEHLDAFADLRIMFQSRAGEPDAGVFGPIRGGLAWRF